MRRIFSFQAQTDASLENGFISSPVHVRDLVAETVALE